MSDWSPETIDLSAQVDAAQAGMRLDQVAAMLFADFSRGRLQKWIRAGQLTVDGQSRKPTHKLSGNEHLRLQAETEREGEVVPQDISLDLIYSDEDLLVLNKPAGLVVHPAAGHRDGALQNGLLFHFPELAAIPRAGIVHRLDKDTSGVMVVARSLRAHHALVDQLQSRTMSRQYHALACGVIDMGGTVDAPIGRHPRDRIRMAVVPSGKAAVTHYRVLRHLERFTELQVSLETGRTHQIRVHMAHIGFPLLGDPVYAPTACRKAGEESGFQRQALHAHRLKLSHPADGRLVSFKAPLAEDFQRLLHWLSQQ